MHPIDLVVSYPVYDEPLDSEKYTSASKAEVYSKTITSVFYLKLLKDLFLSNMPNEFPKETRSEASVLVE
jgi:hypothetical protein